MIKGGRIRCCCLAMLLFAEGTQAVTPDLDSVSSTVLLQIIASQAKARDLQLHSRPCSQRRTHALETQRLVIQLPPVENGDDDNSADEVCLTAMGQASPLSFKSLQHCRVHYLTSGLQLPSMIVGIASQQLADPGSHNGSLVDCHCRLTC